MKPIHNLSDMAKVASCVKIIALSICFCFIQFSWAGQNTPSDIGSRKQLKCSRLINDKLLEVEIVCGDFDKDKHKIQYKDISEIRTDGEKKEIRINGKKPLGTPVVPSLEIKEFKVKWDGNTINIPKSFYDDCYQLRSNWIEILPSQDGNMAMLSVSGSDGAYSYSVSWVINKERVLARFVSNADDQWLIESFQTKCQNN